MAGHHGADEDFQPRRPVTRSLVQNGLIFFVPPVSTKPKKIVKFVDPNTSVVHNSSVASDEGVDVSFSSCSGSINIPASIARPHHSLNQTWSFWFSTGNKRASWKQNQIFLANLASVEEFWSLYNKVQPCSLLPPGQSYSVFMSGVAPDWEDPANARGGRWMLCFDTEERKTKLDNRWLELLFMVLSGRAGSIVTGAEVCVRRKVDRLELWVNDTTDLQQLKEVGRKLKTHFGPGKSQIKFSIHGEEKCGVREPCLMI